MADIPNIQSVGQQILPQVKVYGSYFVSTIAWLLLILVFISIAGVVTYIIYNRMKYNNKIIIFEKINGRWIDTGKDVAQEINFGDLGMKILYCKKRKKYLPKPTKQSGIRKFYFKIRSDGNWENFEFIDDETSDMVKFHSVEKSITERNVGIRKGLAERFKTTSWLKENAVIIVSVMFVIILGVMTWLLFDKFLSIANVTNAGVETSKVVLERADAILGKLDNICSGGSGLKPA